MNSLRHHFQRQRLYRHPLAWFILTLVTTVLPAVTSPAIAHLAAALPTSQPVASNALQQGKALYDAGRYRDALELLQQAIQSAQSTGNVAQQAVALSNLSLVYQQLGRWSEAGQAINQAIALLQSVSSEQRLLLAQALDIQGRLQLAQGQPESALQAWQQSATIYQQHPQSEDLLRNQINQVRALQALGFYRRACNLMLHALSGQAYSCEQMNTSPAELKPLVAHLRPSKPTANTAIALRSLGDILQAVGYSDAARSVLQISLDVATEANSVPNIQAAYLSLGNVGKVQEVLKDLPQDVMNFTLQADDNGSDVQGKIQRAIRATQASLTEYQKAAEGDSNIKLPAQLNQISLLVDTSRVLLNCWQILNDRSAQSAAQQLLLQDLQTKTLTLLTQAQTLLPAAEAQLTDAPLSRTSIYARINLARSLLKYERLRRQQASTVAQFPNLVPLTNIQQWLATAVQQSIQLQDQQAQTFATGYLAEVYEQTQQWLDAQSLTQQAILLSQNSPEVVYRWQWQMGRILAQQSRQSTGAQSTDQSAIAAYRSAIASLQSLRKDLVAINPDIQFNFRDGIEPVYREAVTLLLRQDANQSSDSQQLENARQLIEALQLAELDNFFREACILGQNVILDQVVEQNNTKAAIIYSILLNNQLKVIVKTPNKISDTTSNKSIKSIKNVDPDPSSRSSNPLKLYTSSPTEGQTSIEETILKLRQVIVDPARSTDIKQLSQQVYDWLIRPIEADLQAAGVNTLVFVPDGILRNIPMAALFDGEKYLIEKYAISLSAGLQLLDPKPIARQSLKALTAGLSQPPKEFVNQFAALPGIVEEIHSITEVGVTTTSLIDQQFTRPALQNQINATPYNVVHLATHGKFSSRREETFILAADGAINVTQFDGLLRSRDFLRSEPVELLVLSACQTAEGDNRAILGLAGTALKAGARSTVASLWSVEDKSTAFLVRQFYQELMDPNVTKAEALRRAQLAVLQSPNYQQPSYWAAFVLVGNWL